VKCLCKRKRGNHTPCNVLGGDAQPNGRAELGRDPGGCAHCDGLEENTTGSIGWISALVCCWICWIGDSNSVPDS
jgi:hypothetical protein